MNKYTHAGVHSMCECGAAETQSLTVPLLFCLLCAHHLLAERRRLEPLDRRIVTAHRAPREAHLRNIIYGIETECDESIGEYTQVRGMSPLIRWRTSKQQKREEGAR